MVRWQPDPRGRLSKAALELFGERGYEQTTVAEIAERAGLTKRTFFRYYADKREVLFGGSDELAAQFVSAVTTAPISAAPLDAVTVALDTVTDGFEARRPFATIRQRVIAANPELQERELIKLSSLAEAVAEALRARGVTDPAAILAAEAGITVFHVAFLEWVQTDDGRTLQEIARAAVRELRAVAAS